MQVQITGHHVEVTAGLRTYIVSKLARLEDIFPKVRKASVIVTVEKYRHTVEIHFHAEGVEMSAKKTTKDMYASIDGAVAALEQQASKRKDKLYTSGALRRTAAKVAKSNARAGKVVRPKEEAAPGAPKVVRVKAGSSKPLSVEDAVSLLESNGAPYLLFKDARSGKVNLLFRRDDGNFGLAEA